VNRAETDLLHFLDSADRTEYRRRIPTKAEITRKMKSQELSLQRQIESTERRTRAYEEMQAQLKSQKNDYTRALLAIQASLDRIIRDKENLSESVISLSSEISELESAEPPVLEKLIQTQLQTALVQLKSEMNDQRTEAVRKLAEDSARKAHMEFAPQIHELKCKHASEISIAKAQLASQLNEEECQSRLMLARVLHDIREQFHTQTEDQVARIDKDHTRILDQFREKGERERARFDAEISRIQKSVDSEIAEIRNRYMREIDRERNKMVRSIDDCRGDVISAKRLADQQMQRMGESLEKSQLFQARLVETQYDGIFEEENRSIIQERSKILHDKLEIYRMELETRADSIISEKELALSKTIAELTSANDVTKQEINRGNRMLEKQQSMRKRQKLRVDRSQDELQSVKTAVSQLKDALFHKEDALNEPVLMPDVSIIDDLKRELEQIQSAKDEEKFKHEQQIEMVRDQHEVVCRQTTEKVRLLVERKDQQTKRLRDQLQVVQEKIPTLAKALRE
jgi:hypothetical protein